MRKLVLFICLSISALFTHAQQPFLIKGKIIDSSLAPVVGATITITSLQNHTKILHLVSNNLGIFSASFSREKFLLEVTITGFQKSVSEYTYLPTGNTFILNPIVLKPVIHLLESVTVKNSVPTVTIKEDTIEYKADSFKTRQGDDVEALLRKIPGVKVDKDGSVIAHGQTIKKIKVNGKEFFGSDVTTVTKNLPAEIVDKVQIIDDYGESANFTGFKTGPSEKVINIQLKKDKSNGYFGREELLYGTANRYSLRNNINWFTDKTQTSAILNANNISSASLNSAGAGFGSLSQLSRSSNAAIDQYGGINNVISVINNNDQGYITSNMAISPGTNSIFGTGINHSTEIGRFKLYGSYLYRNNTNIRLYQSYGKQFYGNIPIDNQTAGDDHGNDKGNRAFVNLEFTPGTRCFLKFTGGYQDGQQERTGLNTLLQARFPDTLNYYQQQNSQSGSQDRFTSGLLWKQKFSKYGRSLYMSINHSSFRSDLLSAFDNNDIRKTNLVSKQKSATTGNVYSVGGEINYTEPVLASVFINVHIGIQYQHERTINLLESFDVAQNKFVTNTTNSGLFNMASTLNNAGLDMKHKFGKVIVTAGAEWQQLTVEKNNSVKAEENETQSSLIPRASINYKPSQKLSVILRYSTNFNVPTARQLSPLQDTLNPLVVYKGNPNLKAELIHKMDLFINNVNPVKGNIFLLGANLQLINNKIVQNISYRTTGVQHVSYLNSDHFQSISGYYNFSKPFFNKVLEFTLGGIHTFGSSPVGTSGVIQRVTTYNATQLTQLTYNANSWLEFNAGNSLYWTRYEIGEHIYTTHTKAFFITTTIAPHKFKLTTSFKHLSYYRYLIPTVSQAVLADLSFEMNFNKYLLVKVSAMDLLGQSRFNVDRALSNNQFTDNNYNAPGRYIMIGIALRISKFKELMKTVQMKSQD